MSYGQAGARHVPVNLAEISLTPTETEACRTGVHWFALVWPAAVAALIVVVGVPPLIALFTQGGSFQGSIILAAIASFLFINAAAVIAVRQGRLGKRIGYGTVVVRQFRGDTFRIESIQQPFTLVKAILDEQNQGCNEGAISRADESGLGS